MKAFYFTILLVLGLLFPAASFSQSHREHSLEAIQDWINPDNHPVEFSGFGDILLASKQDVWSNNAWNSTDSSEYYYGVDGLLAEVLRKRPVSGEWIIYERVVLEYDAGYRPILARRQTWDGVNWLNKTQYISEYDANSNELLYLVQTWDGFGWKNDFQYVSEYDNNNNEIMQLWQDWVGVSWVNTFLYSLEYDANNNLIDAMTQEWGDTVWVNYKKRTQEYDDNNNEILLIGQNWDGSNWVNANQQLYEYDANNNEILLLLKYWSGTDWVASSHYIREYDANNNQTSVLYQIWDGFDWKNNGFNSYGYDANNNQVSVLVQNWNGTNWTNMVRIYYYYQLVSGVHNLTLLDDAFVVFPNPNNGDFAIKLNDNKEQYGMLNIYNSSGKLVYSKQVRYSDGIISVQNADLSKGTYFLQVITKGQPAFQTLFVAD